MKKQITFRLSDSYSDIADIHDNLYTFNLSKTKAKRIDVHAERHQEQFAFLACDEYGKSHGGIAFHWKNDPRHIFVDFFFLDEKFRGNGIGKKLFSELISHVKENGAERIDVTTNSFQAPGFYLNLGFKITHEKPEPYSGCPDNIHYSLSMDL